MRSENEIFAAFCDCLDEAKRVMGIPSDWMVMAHSQQAMVNDDQKILVHKISQRRRGWQDEEYRVSIDDGELHEYWCWIDEIVYQVAVVRKRSIDDSEDTVTAEDVAAKLKLWMNSSQGAEYCREQKKLAPMFISANNPMWHTDDNDVYQEYVTVDMPIEVVQEMEVTTTEEIEKVEIDIKHEPPCQGEDETSPTSHIKFEPPDFKNKKVTA